MAAIPSATRVSHDDCTCVEDGCGFLAPPRALLDHLVAEHSLRALRITYGEQYQIVVPASERPLLLLAEENEGVFLLHVREPEDSILRFLAQQASRMVAVHCLRARAGAAEGPAYIWMVSAEGLQSMKKVGRVPSRDGPARTIQAYSISEPGMLHGESEEVHLRICIKIAPTQSWKRRVLKFLCLSRF